jgi:hypothetical protein
MENIINMYSFPNYGRNFNLLLNIINIIILM